MTTKRISKNIEGRINILYKKFKSIIKVGKRALRMGKNRS
jgi:hypothetical protein